MASPSRLVPALGLAVLMSLAARLESDLTTAMATDQAVFTTGAPQARGAFGGLDVAVVVMTVGSAWVLARRLGECR